MSNDNESVYKRLNELSARNKIVSTYSSVRSNFSHLQAFRRVLQQLVKPNPRQVVIQEMANLVKLMPAYTSFPLPPLCGRAISALQRYCPDSLPIIKIVNPSLITMQVQSKGIDFLTYLGQLSKATPKEQKSVLEELKDITSTTDITQIIRFIPAILSNVLSTGGLTFELFDFIRVLITTHPIMLSQIEPPASTYTLSKLVPLNLLNPSNFTVELGTGIIRLVTFAYNCVQKYIKKANKTHILTLHKLLLSGNAAVDSVILALGMCSDALWEAFKHFNTRKYIYFAALFIGPLSTINLPSVQQFIASNKSQLIQVLEKKLSVHKLGEVYPKVYNFLLDLKGLHLNTLSFAIDSLSEKKFSVYLLNQLDNFDYYFRTCCELRSKEIAENSLFCCEIVKKLITAGLPSRNTIEILAKSMVFQTFLSFAVTQNYYLYPALLLIRHSNADFLSMNKQSKSFFVQIITKALFTEIPGVAEIIEYFSSYIFKVMPEAPQQIAQEIAKSSDLRTFLRFLLMLTSTSQFVAVISRVDFTIFKKHIDSLTESKSIDTIGAMCYVWRNMCQKSSEYKAKQIYHLVGLIETVGNFLMASWPLENDSEIITMTFSDVFKYDNLLQILIKIVKPKSQNCSERFKRELIHSNRNVYSQIFKGPPKSAEQTTQPIKLKWDSSEWKKFVTGNVSMTPSKLLNGIEETK